MLSDPHKRVIYDCLGKEGLQVRSQSQDLILASGLDIFFNHNNNQITARNLMKFEDVVKFDRLREAAKERYFF